MPNAVDWSKPVELDDGTQLVVVDAGDPYHVGIRTIGAKQHPAFPIDRNRGHARRECGLVGSNHRYHVRNVGSGGKIERIDLSNRPAKGFKCHNDGAPFEKIEFDHDKTYQEGWFSGLRWGLRGDFYQAGGPGGLELGGRHGSFQCKHVEQYNRIDKARNKLWKDGWRDGQAEAEKRRKTKLNLGREFRTLEADGSHRVPEMSLLDKAKAILTVRFTGDRKDYGFDLWGAPLDVMHDFILENTPMTKNSITVGDVVKARDGSPAAVLLGKNKKFRVVDLQVDVATLRPDGDYQGSTETKVNIADLWLVDTGLTRTGYGIFGQTHTSIFETLAEVSERWWQLKGDITRGTKQLNGEFIMRLEQVRDNGNQPWQTISTSGPIEPLPETRIRYQPVKQCSTGTPYVLGSVYENRSQAEAAAGPNGGAVKVTIVSGNVTNVELLS